MNTKDIELKIQLEKMVIGLSEPILIKGAGKFIAKIDSGNAGYNVIHGEDFVRQGDILNFKTVDADGNYKRISKKVVDTLNVHIGGGNVQERPVVELNIKFANEDYKKVPFSVTDRSHNDEKVLISKNFVRDELDALIDVGKVNMTEDDVVEVDYVTEGEKFRTKYSKTTNKMSDKMANITAPFKAASNVPTFVPRKIGGFANWVADKAEAIAFGKKDLFGAFDIQPASETETEKKIAKHKDNVKKDGKKLSKDNDNMSDKIYPNGTSKGTPDWKNIRVLDYQYNLANSKLTKDGWLKDYEENKNKENEVEDKLNKTIAVNTQSSNPNEQNDGQTAQSAPLVPTNQSVFIKRLGEILNENVPAPQQPAAAPETTKKIRQELKNTQFKTPEDLLNATNKFKNLTPVELKYIQDRYNKESQPAYEVAEELRNTEEFCLYFCSTPPVNSNIAVDDEDVLVNGGNGSENYIKSAKEFENKLGNEYKSLSANFMKKKDFSISSFSEYVSKLRNLIANTESTKDSLGYFVLAHSISLSEGKESRELYKFEDKKFLLYDGWRGDKQKEDEDGDAVQKTTDEEIAQKAAEEELFNKSLEEIDNSQYTNLKDVIPAMRGGIGKIDNKIILDDVKANIERAVEGLGLVNKAAQTNNIPGVLERLKNINSITRGSIEKIEEILKIIVSAYNEQKERQKQQEINSSFKPYFKDGKLIF